MKEYPEREIEQICRDCKLLPTKPGQEPAHLAHAIWIANELYEDSVVCGGFDYPAILNYLDPFEYACLVAIKMAHQASESKSMKKQQEEPQQKADREAQYAHMKRLAHS